MGVASKAREQLVAALQRGEEMKWGNRASGAMPFAIFATDHQRWATGPLHYPRSRDADDAPMPSFSIEHDAARVGKLRFGQSRFQHLHDLLLALLTIGVELVESRCQLSSLLFVAGFEQLDYRLC